MIELMQLKQFAVFSEELTVSAAAKRLNLSQPALSRSMQQFEKEVGVELFERRKNRLTLNENGRLMAEGAKKILTDVDNMIDRIRVYDRSRRTIFIGSCAPAPLWSLSPMLNGLYPNFAITTEIKGDGEITAGLRSGVYQLAVTAVPVEGYLCREFMTERLSVSLKPGHRFAGRESLRLCELNGESMLLANQLGYWDELCRREMPDTHFVMENTGADFEAVAEASDLPFFITDISEENLHRIKGERVIVPISDLEANPTFYCCAGKDNAELIKKLF